MGDSTGISWTDATWNPIRGCSRVSEGCRHCYAERVAARFSGPGLPYEGLARPGRKLDVVTNTYTLKDGARWTGEVRMVPEHLADPIRWKKPRRIFVNSMSDLFHEKLTNEQIAAVFGVMAACPQHTFQVLTKRAKRMREWFMWFEGRVEEIAAADSGGDCSLSIHDARIEAMGWLLADCAAQEIAGGTSSERDSWFDRLDDLHRDSWAHTGGDGGTEWAIPWPLPNVWLGVSVENQEAADERIPELLKTPAAIRFLSCEPLIGEVDIDQPLCDDFDRHGDSGYGIADDGATPWCAECDSERSYGHWLHLDGGIDWVIAGCESGPGARPCKVEWLRSLRDQCAAAGVAYFLKQSWADYWPEGMAPASVAVTFGSGSKRKSGGVIELPYLDGLQHAAFPEVRS